MVHALLTGAIGFVATHLVDQFITLSAIQLLCLKSFCPELIIETAQLIDRDLSRMS